MKSKEGVLLSTKLTHLKKMVVSIDPKDATSNSMKSNSIQLINGLIKDVGRIRENDQKFFKQQKENTGNRSSVWKTGYPCKPIKSRRKDAKRKTDIVTERTVSSD